MSESIDGLSELQERIKQANTIEDWSFILQDHMSFGNNKIAKHVGIFNLNSAHDCPNRETQENGESDTGLCQVEFGQCYAAKAEKMYKNTLPYRRRQEYLWDSLPADMFAKAFLQIVERKRNPVTALRLSEAGDFRTNGDIIRANRIAEILGNNGIDVYTYSSSYKLEAWKHITAINVMESVEKAEYGTAKYNAFETAEDIPDSYIHCPHDYQKSNGHDNPIKCGDCELCVNEQEDIAITLH